jgi:hypothetical protein
MGAPVLLLLQWPLCGLVLELLEGAAGIDVLGIGIVVAAGAWITLARSRRMVLSAGLIGGGALSAAGVAAFRDYPILLTLGWVALLWLALAFHFLASGATRTALVAVNLALLAGGGLLLEAVLVAIEPADFQVDRGTRYRTEDDTTSSRLIPGVVSAHRVKTATGEPVFDVSYTIDGDGSRRVPDRPETGPRWGFFGGSFCFGLGLNDGETLAGQVQLAEPDVRVFNYGIEAQGTADALIRMQRVLAEHPDTQLCVYLMIYDHFRRAGCPDSLTAGFGREAPRFVLEGDELKHVGKAERTLAVPNKIHVKLLRQSLLYGRLSGHWKNDEPTRRLTARLIQEMDRTCRDNGARFAMVILPDQRSEEAWDSTEMVEWTQSLSQGGIQILDCESRFAEFLENSEANRDDYFHAESHPNRDYTRIVGSWIADFLEGGASLHDGGDRGTESQATQ